MLEVLLAHLFIRDIFASTTRIIKGAGADRHTTNQLSHQAGTHAQPGGWPNSLANSCIWSPHQQEGLSFFPLILPHHSLLSPLPPADAF